ncbi:MAG: hypothetical protein AAFN77_06180 [Planctomycetota bacterium]
MSNSIVAQVPKNLLFRYRIGCREVKGKFGARFQLDESYRVPHFGSFEKQNEFADVRVGWNTEGLYFDVTISGKKQSLWCRQSELLESDGVQFWIDTRDTHNIHRATKFCHWFVCLPVGGGPQNTSPVATMLKINRSQEDSPTINRNSMELHAKTTPDGYRLIAFISGKSLHGWNSEDHRHLGFNYAVQDREFGWQTLAVGPELPIREDPSLWQTLSLR